MEINASEKFRDLENQGKKHVEYHLNGEYLRKTAFISLFFFKWPIMFIFFLLRWFRLFDYVFLVYPGTDKDLKGYCPDWLAKSLLFRSKPTFGGFISKSKSCGCGFGLVFVIPNKAQELFSDKSACHDIARRLLFVKKITGVKSVAIAGQAPGIFIRHGIEIDKPFVRGVRGTVFCVIETIEEVMRCHGLNAGNFSIAVVGVGYVGSILLEELEQAGHNVSGIDIKVGRKKIILSEESIPIIQEADMIVVLTPRGSDFAPYVENLKSGAIVIDDTHPRITIRPERAHFYKVAMGMKGVSFFPHLPGYHAQWIPGCAVEAIYSAAVGSFNGSSQQSFNSNARKLGFAAYLVS